MTSRGDYSSTWVFIAGVILLQFGFVIREVGAVRIKDTKRIIIRHVVNLLISGVVFCLFGVVLAFSYGGVADKFIGTTFVYHNELIVYVSILFQSTFASVTSSIVAGAIAERCKLIAYFINTVFISGFIHPVARHWTIDGRGWLNIGRIVYQDNAGSGTIHVVAGIAALVGAAMLELVDLIPALKRLHGKMLLSTSSCCRRIYSADWVLSLHLGKSGTLCL